MESCQVWIVLESQTILLLQGYQTATRRVSLAQKFQNSIFWFNCRYNVRFIIRQVYCSTDSAGSSWHAWSSVKSWSMKYIQNVFIDKNYHNLIHTVEWICNRSAWLSKIEEFYYQYIQIEIFVLFKSKIRGLNKMKITIRINSIKIRNPPHLCYSAIPVILTTRLAKGGIATVFHP